MNFAGFTKSWLLKRRPKLLNHQNPNLLKPIKLIPPIKCFEANKLSQKKKQGFILLTICLIRCCPCTMILWILQNQSRLLSIQLFQGLRPLSMLLKLIPPKRNQHQAHLFQISKLWWLPTPHLFQQNQAIGKKILINLFQLLKENFSLKNPKGIATKAFHENFHYPSGDLLKTREFYEAILVETGYVKIKHNADKYSNLDLAFSTYHIYKILTVKQWGGNPIFSREFSKPSKPRFFNYQDYQRAWFNAFLIQNKDFHHPWMFYFPSKHQIPSFPFWFHNQWTYFGLTNKILPKPILDGFELFNSSFVIPRELSAFSRLLFFFNEFGIAWIVQWDYTIIKDESVAFPVLRWTFKTKWWDALKNDASLQAVKTIFSFFLQANTQKAYIRKGHLEADPKAYREYTKGTKGHKKKRKYKTNPQLTPSQSKN